MSRITIIIISSLGLIVIGVIFLFINAGKKSTVESEAEVMTKDPDKYTYQQLMASAGEHGLRIDEGEEQPANSQPVVNRELLSDDSVPVAEEIMEASSADIPAPEVTTALKEIRQTRLQLTGDSTPVQTRYNKPDTRRSKDLEEDEQIRRIVAQYSSAAKTSQPPVQTESSAIPNTGGNSSMLFKQQKAADKSGSGPASIKGVVLNGVEVVSGAAVPIMLMDNHKVITGTVNIGQDRVQIRVQGTTIDARYENIVFSVYGQDGNEGIRIEGAADPARQAAVNEVENSINQVAGSGVLGSVVNIAKALGTSNKGKQMVKIPSGLKVSLKSMSN